MPRYHMKCPDCKHEEFIVQSIKAEPIRTCPECEGSEYFRVIHNVYVAIENEPKTMGHLADKNRDKMSNLELNEKSHVIETRAHRGREQMGINKSIKSIWRPGTDGPDMSLAQITTKEEIKAFVNKGITPSEKPRGKVE